MISLPAHIRLAAKKNVLRGQRLRVETLNNPNLGGYGETSAVAKKKTHDLSFEDAVKATVGMADDEQIDVDLMSRYMSRGHRLSPIFKGDYFDHIIKKAGGLKSKEKEEFLLATHKLIYKYKCDRLTWDRALSKKDMTASLGDVRRALGILKGLPDGIWTVLIQAFQKENSNLKPEEQIQQNKSLQRIVEALSVPNIQSLDNLGEIAVEYVEKENTPLTKEKMFAGYHFTDKTAPRKLLVEGLLCRWDVTFGCKIDPKNKGKECEWFGDFLEAAYLICDLETKRIAAHIKKAREEIDASPGVIRFF